MSLDELRPHLHVGHLAGAIPYRTSYYDRAWGFCLTPSQYGALPGGQYEVFIDTEFRAGHVEIGEAVLRGSSRGEVLFSSYLCHPSMANNELSGPLVLAFLYQRLAQRKLKFTYRFALMPETIGALCYLSERGALLQSCLIAGYQLTCLGDRGRFTYKQSRHGNSLADRAAAVSLPDMDGHVIPFDPSNGSDERQYCSPRFNLPVGCLMRSGPGQYSQYHTSLDNKAFISFDALAESVDVCERIVDAIEANETYSNMQGYGEPQLGRRGLYRSLSGSADEDEREKAMLWLLNMADGTNDLLAIAGRSGCSMASLVGAAAALLKEGLIA